MFETTVTVCGNVLTAPEWRRTTTSQVLLANFKIASTARRFDRATGQWVDGESFRVRVVCWRRLAEGVSASVTLGDPVIVTGRLYTRDWLDDNNEHRVTYELEAFAVGHDLSRGTAQFERRRAQAGTSAIEDDAADVRVGGERTEPVDPASVRRFVNGTPAPSYDDDAEDFDHFPLDEAEATLRAAGLGADRLGFEDPLAGVTLDEPVPGDDEDEDEDEDDGGTDEAAGADAGTGTEPRSGGRGKGRKPPRMRQPVPA